MFSADKRIQCLVSAPGHDPCPRDVQKSPPMLISQSSAIPQGPGKRLVLSALIGAYIWCGRLTLAWRRVLASAKRLVYYVRGVHLLVLEKTSDPPVESLRLVPLAAGGPTFKMALATPGLIEDPII